MAASQQQAGHLQGGVVEQDLVRAYLQELMREGRFNVPARRARLLEYLVDRRLNDGAGQINEYAIGVDVLDKPASFDPKSDASVRAEIGRLRRSLAEYYSHDGANDSLRISLPPRSYVPVISVRPTTKSTDTRSRRWIKYAAALAFGAAALVSLLLALRPGVPPPPETSLAVLPAVFTPAAAKLLGSASRLPDTEDWFGRLIETPGLNLLDWTLVSQFRGPSAVRQARAELPVSLILQTMIDRRGDSLLANLALFRSRDGAVTWKYQFPIPSAGALNAAFAALAKNTLEPLLDSRNNHRKYLQQTGAVKPLSPCARSQLLAPFPRATAQLRLYPQMLDVRSFDADVDLVVGGQRARPGAVLSLPARVPLPVRSPPIVQLPSDTCVLTSHDGTSPVYDDACIVLPPGNSSRLTFVYTCVPRAWPVDLRRIVNSDGVWNDSAVPSGARVLAGIPFTLPDGSYREWRADAAAEGSPRPVTLVIPVKRASVSRAYFLLNTEWGQPGPESYLALQFSGDKGADFTKRLVGGIDVRDYHNGIYVNTINNTSTRLAYQTSRAETIDIVQVELAAEFHNQTLQTITLRDTGRHNFQRAILRAVTVQ